MGSGLPKFAGAAVVAVVAEAGVDFFQAVGIAEEQVAAGELAAGELAAAAVDFDTAVVAVADSWEASCSYFPAAAPVSVPGIKKNQGSSPYFYSCWGRSLACSVPAILTSKLLQPSKCFSKCQIA